MWYTFDSSIVARVPTRVTECDPYLSFSRIPLCDTKKRNRCSPTDVHNPLLLDHVAVPAQAPHGASYLCWTRVVLGGPGKQMRASDARDGGGYWFHDFDGV